jgi:NADPH:quinone reductase-like Zn-dependent oxidoreductase
MKAIVQDTYGSPDVLNLREIDTPEVGDDEALVRVHAADVDRGVWHLITGLPYLARLAFGLLAPKTSIPGMDLAGVVEAVGKNVCRFEQAAVLAISGLTALQSLARPRKGRDGAEGARHRRLGRRGHLCRADRQGAYGAHVTGVYSTTKVEMVRSIGADHVIDYTREDFADSSRRWDVILDIGGSSALRRVRRALTPQGTLVIVGGEGGGRWLGVVNHLLRAHLLFPFVSQKLGTFISSENQKDMMILKELIESGKVTSVIDRTYPLAEVPEAIRYLKEGHVRGKVVITLEHNDKT